ncbi:MBL fold metallo-hydrolase [Candidatus Bipolaricaulota bacterium]|nr:MBL fold metallo-hydrolase [Candidatus Bipolaricaulota bacterium]
MSDPIRTLTFRWVNAYLVSVEGGFILIDTGLALNRPKLLEALREEGCRSGNLKLVVITHGDSDHCGSASYLRKTYGAPIGMHRAEAAAVQRGNLFLSREPLSRGRRLLKPAASLFGPHRRDRFTPDVFLGDGDRLTEYGFDATVLHVPGHSAGSIAVLADTGDFFSGDFLENRKKPSIATLFYDADVLRKSFDRVKPLQIRRVYPGHGDSFTFDEIPD